MNYIKQLNEFYSTLDYKPLTAEAISIYYMLLQIANKTGWIDQFRVANTVLLNKCNISKSKLERARNKLISQGYILYSKGKNQTEAPIYSIVQLYSDTPDDTPNDTPNNTPDDTPDGTPNGTPNDTINKQNKTKQNKILYEHFEQIWKTYPVKKGKSKAETYFFAWLKGRKINGRTKKLTDKDMWYAVQMYLAELKETKIDLQYVPHGSTFFNSKIYDYYEIWRDKYGNDNKSMEK